MTIKKMVATTSEDFKNIDLIFHFDDGGEEHKMVSINNYLMAIQESIDVGKDFLRIGKSPNGFYDGIINMNNPSSFKVVLTVPGSLRIINYFGDSYAIPFPDMAFFFETRNGKIYKSLTVALDTMENERIDDGAIVCFYPFGNVYPDFRICWGANELRPVTCLKDAEQYVAKFFNSETNNDLYAVGANVPNIPEFTNQRGLIEALAERNRYPKEWMVTSTGTFGEMVSKFLT